VTADKCKENDLLRNINSDIQLCAGAEAGKQLESISSNFFGINLLTLF
jgi:hypothetical protein